MTTVLLADDHSFMRAGVEAVLRGSRYTIVATAGNGDEALAALARTNPDICIFDVRMPVRSGLEVLQHLRARGDLRPVILLTAELEDTVLLEAMRIGVEGIVLKDAAGDELVACLDTVASGRKAIAKPLLQRALDLSLHKTSHPLDRLAPRERQIAGLIARGMRNRDIGQAIGMTEGTIKVYLHSIYQKLGIENRTELALMAHDRSAPTGDT